MMQAPDVMTSAPIAVPVPAPKPRKPKGKSPNSRSKAHMEKLGYIVDIVERRLPRGFVTKDLYGFIDLLCVKGEDIVGVQATSGAHVADRVAKIVEHDNWPLVCKAIRVVVHGWRKNSEGRWVLREQWL
jgi:hypothetical protein